jgi:hypothetical protein
MPKGKRKKPENRTAHEEIACVIRWADRQGFGGVPAIEALRHRRLTACSPRSNGPTSTAFATGYSAKTAREIGHQNLTKLHIAAEIETARAKRAERCELTADWVADELRKIAGANLADYMKSTTEGDPYRDFFGTDA